MPREIQHCEHDLMVAQPQPRSFSQGAAGVPIERAAQVSWDALGMFDDSRVALSFSLVIL